MLTFVRNDRGKTEAEEGAHDDLVMGLAIAFYIRNQQTKRPVPLPKPKYVEADYSPFGIKKEESRIDDLKNTVDYGEKLLVV